MPTCLSPHVHDHVPQHGLISPQSYLAQNSLGLPQVDEALNVMERQTRLWELRVLTGLVWSGLVWRWSGCLAWLGLAGLGIRRSPPPASSWGPSICSVVNVHASLHELCHIQPKVLFKDVFSCVNCVKMIIESLKLVFFMSCSFSNLNIEFWQQWEVWMFIFYTLAGSDAAVLCCTISVNMRLLIPLWPLMSNLICHL